MYNLEHQIYIPSLDYFKSITGLDYVIESGHSEEVAKQKFLGFSLKAKDLLMQNKSARFQNAFGYLISQKTNWQDAFKRYVTIYVECTMIYGDESAWQNTPKELENMVNGSILKSKELTSDAYYQIERSGKVW